MEGFLVSSKKLILPAGKCSRRRAKIRKNEQYNASCFDSNHQDSIPKKYFQKNIISNFGFHQHRNPRQHKQLNLDIRFNAKPLLFPIKT